MAWVATAVTVAGAAYSYSQQRKANAQAAANAKDQALTESAGNYQDKVTSYVASYTDAANADTQFIQSVKKSAYESSLSNALFNIQSDDLLLAADTATGKILDHARAVRSSQMAINAGNGVLVGEGTSQVIQDRTTELAMSDTLATLYSGARDAYAARQQGQFALAAGQEAIDGAVYQNVSNKEAIALKTGAQQTGLSNRQLSINSQLSSTLSTISARNDAAKTQLG